MDVAYQWLRFFLEDDDRLEEIRKKYTSGEMSTGEIKEILAVTLIEFIEEFQERRNKVTDEDVEKFTKVRPINMYPKAW